MSLHSACLATLGLRQSPFEPTPEPQFVYDDSLLESLADVACRALIQPNAIVILTGVNGVGRSTQLMRLLGMLPETQTAIAFRARPHTAFETVELTIRHHLRSQVSGSTDTNTPLPDLLIERQQHGPMPVLAIDDVQLLVPAAVEQLLRLRRQLIDQSGIAPGLVLVGDQSLAQLQLPELDAADDERVVYLHLRPFNREQVAEYLLFRLQTAGCATPEMLIARAPLDRLHENSQGLPGDINRMAEAWLVELCRPVDITPMPLLTMATLTPDTMETALPAPAVPPPAPVPAPAAAPATPAPAAPTPVPPVVSPRRAWWQRRWLIPAVVGGALLALLVPLFWQHSSPSLEHMPPVRSASDKRVVIQPVTPPAPSPVAAAAPAPAPLTPPAASPVTTAPATPPEASPPVTPSPVAATPPAAVTPAPPAPPPERSPPPSPVAIVTPSPAPAAAPAPEPVPAKPVATETAAAPAPVASPPAAAPAAKPAAEPAAVAAQPTADSAPAESPPPPVTPPPAPALSPQATLQADRAWLLAQNPRHVTIQLIAMETLATARAHVAAYGITDVRFVTTRTGRRNYIVALMGSFPDQAAAERAVNTLPPPLRQQGHWLRTVGSVRESLR